MSLEHVNAFYKVLESEQNIYEQYYKQCSLRGAFGVWNWDKHKIINFAANLGYSFTESELNQVLFECSAGVTSW